jgi:hypothetical protein
MRTLPHVHAWEFDEVLAVLVGGLVAAVLVAMIFWRKTATAAGPGKRSALFRADQFEFSHYDRLYGDQRITARREGGYVPLLLTSPSFSDGLKSGVVLDRSTGGLRIAAEEPVPPGCPLQIRVAEAPPDTPWVGVAVRNCQAEPNRYVLGCEFESTPPWNVLLLFG